MNWYLMAVFLYCAALTHFLADLINHWMEKRGKFLPILLHSALYAVFFSPLFWWLEVNFLWLILIFGSHTLIDSQWDSFAWLVEKILRHEEVLWYKIVTLGLDQALHLSVPIIIALFAF